MQFSLRSLMVLVLALSVPLGWLAVKQNQKRREREAVAAFEKFRGRVEYNWTEEDGGVRPGPAWLRRLLGDDFFVQVRTVYLRDWRVTDEDLPPLERLTGIQELRLSGTVSNAGLVHLKGLTGIKQLHLDGTAVSDAGLVHLKGLTGIKQLHLDGTAVSDAGLVHLKGLTGLELLSLVQTDVTSPGAAELQRALPRCKIICYEDSGCFKIIHQAARQGDVEAIRQELNKGVPVDLRVKNEGGSAAWRDTTPLMWAAARGQVAAVKVLIQAKADVNAKNIRGVTPLMAAAGSVKTISGDPTGCLVALLKGGANLEAVDPEGQTALFYACGEGNSFDEPPDRLLPPELRMPNPFAMLRRGVVGSIVGGHIPRPWRRFDARHGDAARLKALLEAGANVKALSKRGSDALIHAAHSADASAQTRK